MRLQLCCCSTEQLSPSDAPTKEPIPEPTDEPTRDPTKDPTVDPTAYLTNDPMMNPTSSQPHRRPRCRRLSPGSWDVV